MPLRLRIQEAPGSTESDVADHLDRGRNGLLAGLIRSCITEECLEDRTVWIDRRLARRLEVGRGQGADVFGRGLVEDLHAAPSVDGVGADLAIQAAAVSTQLLTGLSRRASKFERIVDEHRAHRDGATDTDDDINKVLGQVLFQIVASQIVASVIASTPTQDPGRARGPMASKLLLVLFVEIPPIPRRDVVVVQHVLGQGQLARYAVEPEQVDWRRMVVRRYGTGQGFWCRAGPRKATGSSCRSGRDLWAGGDDSQVEAAGSISRRGVAARHLQHLQAPRYDFLEEILDLVLGVPSDMLLGFGHG
ncbi:uncharacterized protein PG986_006406 [Apiospora aurea]|uniref:Uncharacterized protein n=1 Tax=Apiospora aurea TaxID=335848 RepID=A0ABR1QKB6_9PEZI